MNLTKPMAAFAALLWSFVAPALADSRDEALQAIGKCAGIAEDKARLACYDALSGRVKDALATPPKSLDHEPTRSEEHTSELQSRFGISYAVFCLKKKKKRR